MYLEGRVVWDFQDFSLFGAGQGLQGATIKNLLVFLKSIKQSRPHVLVHENVLGFPIDIVAEQLQGFMSILYFCTSFPKACKGYDSGMTYFYPSSFLRFLWYDLCDHQSESALWSGCGEGQTIRNLHLTGIYQVWLWFQPTGLVCFFFNVNL